MNRRTARAIHEATNLTYWLENPDWNPDGPIIKLGSRALRALPFSVHEAQKRAFFKSEPVAVGGETVVVANGTDRVDKFMFRYPGKMPLDAFKNRVAHEVGVVTSSLVGIALPTDVGIKPANLFKLSRGLPAVVQTQRRLDLNVHPEMDLPALIVETPSPLRDKTAKDLEQMLQGTEVLKTEYGYCPDVANSGGNLRRSTFDGAVTLIDVMPIHADGTRLIDDNPPGLLAHALDNIQKYQEFVGQYGG